MKRSILIILLALALGTVGFFITRDRCTCSLEEMTAGHDGPTRLPELAWLRKEFALTDEQLAKVSALHLAYRPTCETLCMKVMVSHNKVKSLVDAGQEVTPALKAALEEHAALHVECQSAMLAHLYETAACMSPEQSRRYLDVMLPQVIEMAMEPAGHATSAH